MRFKIYLKNIRRQRWNINVTGTIKEPFQDEIKSNLAAEKEDILSNSKPNQEWKTLNMHTTPSMEQINTGLHTQPLAQVTNESN